jgi:hypothetical protein
MPLAATVDALAARTVAPRGLRALLNDLVVDGFHRDGERYGLGLTAASDRSSPTYLGSAVTFVASPLVVEGFTRLTDAVRRGARRSPPTDRRARASGLGGVARAMAPIASMMAVLLVNLDIEHAPGESLSPRPWAVRDHVARLTAIELTARLAECARGRCGERRAPA